MSERRLILSIPHGILTATTHTVEGYAWHRRPGSGKYFQGRTILVNLAVANGKPDFRLLDEGGWRDANADTAAALAAVGEGKKTKTALSNNAFSCTPVAAYREIYLVKTGGELLALEGPQEVARFAAAKCDEEMSPTDIARAIGQPQPARREPRLYMTLAPVEMLVLSNLTPAEYTWYATHRPGKVFRQVMFAEVDFDPKYLVAEAVYDGAKEQLASDADKKTKTVMLGDCLNKVHFAAWVGYDREAEGGLYVGDAEELEVWSFPKRIPRAWERAY
ncbi:MAG: hypothetical protein IT373_31955 [Polyangiaceae bacterium]|nr:hypothetical protein [Polyangiaceae bacterium]